MHHLLVAEHTSRGDITRICAHQQALAQCRNWLEQHFPNVEKQAVSSNGEAARLAQANTGVAASSTPFARVTGMWEEDALTATSARAFGLICPVSVQSTVPRTLPRNNFV